MPACYSSEFLTLPSKYEKDEYFRPLKNNSSYSQIAQVDLLKNIFYDLKSVKARKPHPHLPVCSSPLRNQVPYFDDPNLINDHQTSTFEDQFRFWISRSKKSVYSNFFGSPLDFQLQSKRKVLWGRFVGSYEETLFNCKMPLNPSQYLPFVVDIGVISRCKCLSSLVCPPHFKMRFWSAYYITDDSDFQSPYVGQFYVSEYKTQKHRKRKTVYGYQIPQVGQLQLIIKSLDGILMKVFLIQYDLSDMPTESRASIRQTIYLDPFCDGAESSSKHLKYGVHLQVRSSFDNQYFLHGVQRVIFSSCSLLNSKNTVVVNKQPYP
ncbi:chromosome segregation protein [Schizosaccharomyces octosporus yFS286]|uniref:Chromosome segregation protein n=1 Tax=Schizosaccharomyces octosporus (strain yFS286) TaxID=483514 RepID=S9R8C2_SCHOY|nr:chromosome segregation protein [Schizosaccharomyces octosporus yFS286]EPX74465.1 chromosome segregation protein [Schizosaccharomyces octosporus yFS286]